MSFKKLEEFIQLAKEAGVSSLKYESKDEKFSVTIGGGEIVHSYPAMTAAPVAHVAAAPSAAAPAASSSEGLIEITSPFVGTFYRSSSPGSEAYTKLGDKIAPGKVLCIVEAMKIMNEIEAEVSGEIVEICVENENYVEFGQVLFKVKP
ncbi:MAG: acetyl-CoA carboxylase biotin carboxyl carrier protein [Deltaproteobacteria bacterium]|jgi:acetyl-CoA carboxylase biotin carboxyl carrier protein|nr:MAG: acetyl-CoA carboxylase biotin carboxyl carrier protein [Deltaproteobacteria bacterium]TNF28610.1 MAG: acetyl-CoA carboxylase biotin carboxyl carrier protein [Deltaproteobacteria bacterium]